MNRSSEQQAKSIAFGLETARVSTKQSRAKTNYSLPKMPRRGIGQKEERNHYDRLIVAGAALLVGALIPIEGWALRW